MWMDNNDDTLKFDRNRTKKKIGWNVDMNHMMRFPSASIYYDCYRPSYISYVGSGTGPYSFFFFFANYSMRKRETPSESYSNQPYYGPRSMEPTEPHLPYIASFQWFL